MSNSWASGGHIVCWKLCLGPHEIFDLEITTSPGDDLSNVARIEVELQKKVCTFQVCPRRARVACVQGIKHLFEDVTLQYCRTSLGILESPRGPH